MLTKTSQILKTIHPITTVDSDSISGLSRLVSAAVIDSTFCKLLLSNPALALEKGYFGKHFRLSYKEHQRILSIKATSLPDFARQILDFHPV